jgi:hypothetical protein
VNGLKLKDQLPLAENVVNAASFDISLKKVDKSSGIIEN